MAFNLAEITSSHYQLLLKSCRLNQDEKIRNQTESLLPKAEDWEIIYQLAVTHHLTPLIYHNIRKTGPFPPQKLLEKMHNRVKLISTTNLLQETKRNKILKALDQAKIRAIPIKGLVFSHMIYGQEMPRFICDLDVLIQREDILKADKLLKEAGFVAQHNLAIVKNWHNIFCCNHYYKKDALLKTYTVEVNWDLLPADQSKPGLITNMWKRVSIAEVNGVQMLVLTPEDTLLYIAMEFIRDMTKKVSLRSMCDIVNLLSRYKGKLDWDYIIGQCNKNKITAYLYFVIYFAKELFGVKVRGVKINTLKRALFKPLIQRRISSQCNLSSNHLNPEYLLYYFLPSLLSISSPVDFFKLFKVLLKRACYFSSKLHLKN